MRVTPTETGKSQQGSAEQQLSLAEALQFIQPERAMGHYATAIQQGIRDPRAYCNLAALLIKQKRHAEAVQVCDAGLAVCGENIQILSNCGSALGHLARYGEALDRFRRQAKMQSPQEAPWCAMGHVLQRMGHLKEAEECFRVASHFEQPNAPIGLAQTLLLAGRLREGFQEYERRWESDLMKKEARGFKAPKWDGSNPSNKTILLWAEQGYGDTIQFVRYAPVVAASGAKVKLAVQKRLVELVALMPGNFEILVIDSALHGFDFHCPLMSLPHLCDTEMDNIPPPASFNLPLEREQDWRQRLEASDQLKVAVAWAGSSTHADDHNRSIGLALLRPLFELPMRFFSVQVGGPADQIQEEKLNGRLTDLSPWLTTFLETACALSQMDLVITVDTAVAHLAGSLEVTVWTLLPYAPDFRWLLGRQDSPWYPTMRLFRQPAPTDWDGVVAQVRSELIKRHAHWKRI